MAPDLQIHQPTQKQKKAYQYQQSKDKDAGTKPGQIALNIAQFHGVGCG